MPLAPTAARTKKLLSEPELCEWLGVPPKTATQWRYLGKGPKWVKVGRHVRYRPEDVERWLDEQTRGGAA